MADLTLPVVAHRNAEHYLGIAAKVAFSDLEAALPLHFDELFAWFEAKKLEPGIAFTRYNVIDMAGTLDLEFCFTTAEALEGDDRVRAGSVPAGDYGMTRLTGSVDEVFDATAVLVGWAKERGVEWDAHDSLEGHAFASRVERYLSDPEVETDPTAWRFEIAIKTR